MEIPELIVALQLKLKCKEEEIAEEKRKTEMKEYDLCNYKKEINKYFKEHNVT